MRSAGFRGAARPAMRIPATGPASRPRRDAGRFWRKARDQTLHRTFGPSITYRSPSICPRDGAGGYVVVFAIAASSGAATSTCRAGFRLSCVILWGLRVRCIRAGSNPGIVESAIMAFDPERPRANASPRSIARRRSHRAAFILSWRLRCRATGVARVRPGSVVASSGSVCTPARRRRHVRVVDPVVAVALAPRSRARGDDADRAPRDRFPPRAACESHPEPECFWSPLVQFERRSCRASSERGHRRRMTAAMGRHGELLHDVRSLFRSPEFFKVLFASRKSPCLRLVKRFRSRGSRPPRPPASGPARTGVGSSPRFAGLNEIREVRVDRAVCVGRRRDGGDGFRRFALKPSLRPVIPVPVFVVADDTCIRSKKLELFSAMTIVVRAQRMAVPSS